MLTIQNNSSSGTYTILKNGQFYIGNIKTLEKAKQLKEIFSKYH